MAVTELARVTLIAPRTAVPDLFQELYEFKWFHLSEQETLTDARLAETLSRTKRIRLELDMILQELGIQAQPGVIDMLKSGYKLEREKVTVENIEHLLEKVEKEAKPILTQCQDLLKSAEDLAQRVSDLKTLYAALVLVSSFSVDLSSITNLKRLHVSFLTCSLKDVAEIRRSLPGSALLEHTLARTQSALLIVSLPKDAERIDRTLKSFGLKPFSLPPDLPQNPVEAFTKVQEKITILERKLEQNNGRIKQLITDHKNKILSFQEVARVLQEVFEAMNYSGKLKRVGIIKGFVPKELLNQFNKRFEPRFPYVVEKVEERGEMENHERHPKPTTPVLLQNKKAVRPFQNVTLMQGYPSYGEVDPTPYISVFFTVFYGMMFADIGHGAVLALLGLFLRIRGNESLKLWGSLISILGISATLSGFLVGEVFGFKLHLPFTPPLELVDEHTKQFSPGIVIEAFRISILLGVVHLLIGYGLGALKMFRKSEYLELLTSRIPTILMYLFGILFALAFFGAEQKILDITRSQNPVPLLGLPTATTASVAIVGSFASIFVIVFGKTIAKLLGRAPKLSLLGSLGNGLLEVLENIIQFLSNSVSYSRIAILLMVHAALLLLLNQAWEGLGLAALPLLIVGNIGIMALEGMIVFIQSLRLHLYEWMTKFYEAEGLPFRKIAQDTIYSEIRFSK